jgi:hypothetical protein
MKVNCLDSSLFLDVANHETKPLYVVVNVDRLGWKMAIKGYDRLMFSGFLPVETFLLRP